MAKASTTTLPLFPDPPTPAAQPLVGIARLAAAGEAVDHGYGIEFRALAVRSLLNRSVSKRHLQFAWSINPYRGCEFACRYCYARYTHEFMEMREPEQFERRIFIKQNAAWLLRQELGKVKPSEEIAIGTATDPYQPIERRARVTASVLEVLAERQGLRVGIVTKSALIRRDIQLLQRIASANELVVHVTITTPNTGLARILEPRAPRPDLRFETVSLLRRAGLRVGILCSPLLPGITDTGKALDLMGQAARAAGASFFSAQPLFLKPCSKDTYLGFVRQHFPQLEPMYRDRFATEAFVPKAYAERMRALVRATCKKHGLRERSGDALLTRELALPPTLRPPDAAPLLHSIWPDRSRLTPQRLSA